MEKSSETFIGKVMKFFVLIFLWKNSKADKNHIEIIIKRYVLPIVVFSIIVAIVIFIRKTTANTPESNWDGLISNLKSGITPAIIAIILLIYHNKLNPFFFWLMSILWLVYYPNSSYMITDLNWNQWLPPGTTSKMDIIEQTTFNTLILFLIALLSIFYGNVSLKIMHYLFKERYTEKFSNIAIVITIILSGFAFYMGRMVVSGLSHGNGLMYTSDLFHHPLEIIKGAWNSFFPISDNQNAYYMIALFVLIQFVLISIMEKHDHGAEHNHESSQEEVSE